MAGAQVVPIFSHSTEAQLSSLLSKINGVLFPGRQLFMLRRINAHGLEQPVDKQHRLYCNMQTGKIVKGKFIPFGRLVWDIRH